MAEKAFQGLPKYMKNFRETAMLIAEDLGNRVWNLKTEIERRIHEMTNKPEQQSQSRAHFQCELIYHPFSFSNLAKKSNKQNPSSEKNRFQIDRILDSSFFFSFRQITQT